MRYNKLSNPTIVRYRKAFHDWFMRLVPADTAQDVSPGDNIHLGVGARVCNYTIAYDQEFSLTVGDLSIIKNLEVEGGTVNIEIGRQCEIVSLIVRSISRSRSWGNVYIRIGDNVKISRLEIWPCNAVTSKQDQICRVTIDDNACVKGLELSHLVSFHAGEGAIIADSSEFSAVADDAISISISSTSKLNVNIGPRSMLYGGFISVKNIDLGPDARLMLPPRVSAVLSTVELGAGSQVVLSSVTIRRLGRLSPLCVGAGAVVDVVNVDGVDGNLCEGSLLVVPAGAVTVL